MVGIAALALAAIEATATAIIERKMRRLWRAEADSYRNAPWARAYWEEHARLQDAWEPYSYNSIRPYRGRYLNVDADGNRHTWNPSGQGVTNGRRLVYMFGGSAMWGFGARDDHTIPSVLSQRLYADGLPVQVMNCAQIAHVSTQQVIVLLKTLETHPVPDVVVFYDGFNEIYSTLNNARAGVTFFERVRADEFRILGRPDRLLRGLVESSGLVRLARYHDPPLPIPVLRDPQAADRLVEDLLRRYAANVRIVEETAQARGFKALFYWQPTIFQKNYLTAYEQRMTVGGPARDFFLKVDQRLRRYPALTGEDNFHNLADIFSDAREPCYIDRVHVNEAGNHRIAQRMFVDVTGILRAGFVNDGRSRGRTGPQGSEGGPGLPHRTPTGERVGGD